MNIVYDRVLITAAILLCGGSLACSVALFALEQPTLIGAVLAGIFAGALELCKFAFFPVGLYLCLKSRPLSRAMGGVVVTLGCFLLFVSVAASVGFFESASVNHSNITRNNSDEYQATQKTIAFIDQQIEIINTLTRKDAETTYRQRAIDTMPKLAAL